MTAEDAALMERGRDLLKSGDIASARLLFQRLANAGIADAALALAATYDPRYLIGVAGDETKARDWYQRARELVSTEAGRILARTNAD
jgi:TPR repeat protein